MLLHTWWFFPKQIRLQLVQVELSGIERKYLNVLQVISLGHKMPSGNFVKKKTLYFQEGNFKIIKVTYLCNEHVQIKIYLLRFWREILMNN